MIGKNFDSKTKNIDTLIDMIVSVQQENGVEVTMKEALFDPITKERINKFKREKLEKNGVDLSKYSKGDSKCSSCGKCENGTLSNIERGIFVYNEDDLIDDSDEGYICEYCTKIGYDNAYRPDVCDTCDDCEECVEYMSGECDGCEYSSVYNGGVSYSEANSNDVDYKMNIEDELLIQDIEDGGPDYEVMKPNKEFTVMKY